ncbi:MAG: c-type cytochrome [Hyphomicrobium sp.]
MKARTSKKTLAATVFGFVAGALYVSAAWAMGGNLSTKGEQLLNENCAKCHAVGAEGDSKIATVKPFRDVIQTLPADELGSAFIAAMNKNHKEFAFEPMDAKAIGDYLDKLKLHLDSSKK